MNSHFRIKLRLVVPVALLLLSVSGARIAVAASVPGIEKPVSLNAIEQEVPAFVEALFSQIGVPVRVDPEIPGMVNGLFEGSAEEVFQQLSNAFNVYLYFDQTVAHVYRADQLTSSIMPMTSSQSGKIIKSANKIGLPDSKNKLKNMPDGGLMVSGSMRFVEQIEELSAAIQKNVKRPAKIPIDYRLFHLKYAWADDVTLAIGGQDVVIPGVATMLRALVSQDPMLQSLAVTRSSSRSNTIPKLRGQGLQTVGGAQLQTSGGAGQTIVIANGAEGVSGEGTENTQNKVHQQRYQSKRSNDDFSIVAQPQLNAVAIRDRADRMQIYERLIASLDVEPQMVEIEATIIDINSDMQRELGVNWRLQNGDNQALLGEGITPGTNTSPDILLNPNTQQGITPAGRGGILSLILGDRTQFIARLRALEEKGAARIVSKPHVITLSNVEAVLGAVTEFFVRVEGNEEVDLFNVPVGTTLRVTPHVFTENGEYNIKLLVHIEDGAASPDQQVDSIPIVQRSTISTQALIREGSSLLIGGMARESLVDTVTQVPGLGSIPGLGRLFKTDTKRNAKTERLFLITPRVVSLAGDSRPSGPILQGKPAAIIQSSASRLDPTLALFEEDGFSLARSKIMNTNKQQRAPATGNQAPDTQPVQQRAPNSNGEPAQDTPAVKPDRSGSVIADTLGSGGGSAGASASQTVVREQRSIANMLSIPPRPEPAEIVEPAPATTAPADKLVKKQQQWSVEGWSAAPELTAITAPEEDEWLPVTQ